jgi:hypothetical protein
MATGRDDQFSNDVASTGNAVTATESAPATPMSGARRAVDAIVEGGKAAGQGLSQAARATGEAASKAAVLVGDLNDDGKLDEQDAKIAAAKVKKAAATTADEAGGLLKEISKHDMVKDAAAGAAIGAVVAIPIPFVGPAVGAAFGAIGGVVKNILSGRRSR